MKAIEIYSEGMRKMFRRANKKLIIILCSLICITFFPMNYISIASNNTSNIILPNDVINWSTALDVPTKKDWTIKFNQPIDDNYANQEYFFVVDSANKLHPVKIFLSADKRELLIQVEIEYLAGETYRLYIMSGIKSDYGKLLDKSIRMYFIIQDDSEIVTPAYSEFYAIVSNNFGAEIQLLRNNNIKEWYYATYLTELIGKKLRELGQGDLVKVKAGESELNSVEYIDKSPMNITSINKDSIELGEQSFELLEDTFIYVINKDIKAMSIADFINNYDTSKTMTGYVVESVKKLKTAEIIVITEAIYNDNMLDTIIGKISRIYMRDNICELTIERPDNLGSISSVHRIEDKDTIELINNQTISVGDIVELKVGNDEQDIFKITKILNKENQPLYKVVSMSWGNSSEYRRIELQDRNGEIRSLWVVRNAAEFGTVTIDSLMAFITDDNGDIILFEVRPRGDATGVWP